MADSLSSVQRKISGRGSWKKRLWVKPATFLGPLVIQSETNEVFPLKRFSVVIAVAAALLAGCGSDQESTQAVDLNQSTSYPPSLSCRATQLSDAVENPFVSLKESKDLSSSWLPLLGNPYARNHLLLNGSWQYIVDQLDMGDRGMTMRGGVGQGRDAVSTELLEYGFNDDHSMMIPGDWNSADPSLEWYRGVLWFKRDFVYSPAEDQRTILYFGGAYLHKDIYLNGELISRHHGGFTAFNIDVTDKLKTGQNRLVVKVDSRSGASGIPTEYNDWINYGGITRDVMLLQVPDEYIHNYKIQLDKDDVGYISGWIQLAGEVTSSSVSVSIDEAGVELDVPLDSKGYGSFKVAANDLTRWSVENPYRYSVTLESDLDKIADKIGFRSIEVKGNEVLLNGESIFLRGISMHEETMLRLGRATGKEDADTAVAYLNDLNANFVRLAHYQHNVHMIEAAEAAGILIWEELPIYHAMDYGNACTLESAKQQFSEMIARDQNRAAVIFWSVSNETPISDERNHFLGELAAHVRHRDPTRLITSALFGQKHEMEQVAENAIAKVIKNNGRNKLLSMVAPDPDPVTITLEDPLGAIVDVIGYNEYLGWYISGIASDQAKSMGLDVTEAEIRAAMLKEMETVTIKSIFDKPLIISEFGAGAKQGVRGEGNLIWSEDYQASVYRQQFKLLENIPDLVGMSPWVLKDFRAPYRLNTTYQDYWNRKGLVSETGVKKAAFDELSHYYQQKSEGQVVSSVAQ